MGLLYRITSFQHIFHVSISLANKVTRIHEDISACIFSKATSGNINLIFLIFFIALDGGHYRFLELITQSRA